LICARSTSWLSRKKMVAILPKLPGVFLKKETPRSWKKERGKGKGFSREGSHTFYSFAGRAHLKKKRKIPLWQPFASRERHRSPTLPRATGGGEIWQWLNFEKKKKRRTGAQVLFFEKGTSPVRSRLQRERGGREKRKKQLVSSSINLRSLGKKKEDAPLRCNCEKEERNTTFKTEHLP